MTAMTPRERLRAVLSGQPTDRVPFWLLFPYHRLGCYVDVRTHPGYRSVHEASLGKAIVLNRRGMSVPLFTDEVEIRNETSRDGDTTVERRVMTYRGAQLYGETRVGPSGTAVKKMLDNEEDLEVYASFPVLADEGEIVRRLETQRAAYLAEREEFPAEYGEMMLDLGEPVGPVYGSSNLEEYAVWSITHPSVVEGVMDRFMERLRVVYRWCLENDLAETYFLVGSELASPPLMSRQTFRRWIVPYAKELIGMIHAAGKKAIQHYHGQIREILPDFLEMGADALHTIEAPPTGNCTFTQAFEVTGDAMALIGNVQYDRFRAATPEEMAAETQAVIEECRGRRFILSPSAGPYDPNLTETTRRNYLAFIETAWNAKWP